MRVFDRHSSAKALAAAAAIVAIWSGCGGSGSPARPSPGNGPVGATIVISASGVTPKTVTISVGETVNVLNNDNRPREIASNPHPRHTDCPPINALDILSPGQSRNTGNFTIARTCGFHDHGDPDNPAFQGSITIR
jgi:hypothetical protein